MQEMPGMLPRRFSMPEESTPFSYPEMSSQNLLEAEDDFHATDRRNLDEGILLPIPSKRADRSSQAVFSGIFSHLTRECHDNPVKAGLVVVSGNSYNEGYNRILPHLVDPGWRGSWTSTNENGSYLSFDFLEHKVCVFGYALKTYKGNSEWRHLRNWVIEGSNGSGWREIHAVKKCNKLNGPGLIATFKCGDSNAAASKQKFYQIIRLRVTDKNVYGDYYLNLSGIELFGIYD